MLKGEKNASAFTLLEMLIVVVIIAILAGIVLKLMSLSRNVQERSACVAVLERVSYALNEYRAEYGQYPAVQSNACIGFTDQCHPKDCRTCYTTAPGDNGSEAPDPGAADYIRTRGGAGTYGYGLVSFLVPHMKGNMFTNLPSYVNDTTREELVKRRWLPFLTNMVDGCENWGWCGRAATESSALAGSVGSSQFKYYVPQYTLRDPWWHVLRYRSSAPYSSYELWSPGPDNRDGDNSYRTGNDGPEKAKDNIHYKHGKWDG